MSDLGDVRIGPFLECGRSVDPCGSMACCIRGDLPEEVDIAANRSIAGRARIRSASGSFGRCREVGQLGDGPERFPLPYYFVGRELVEARASFYLSAPPRRDLIRVHLLCGAPAQCAYTQSEHLSRGDHLRKRPRQRHHRAVHYRGLLRRSDGWRQGAQRGPDRQLAHVLRAGRGPWRDPVGVGLER